MIEDLMTRRVITVRPETLVHDAAPILDTRNIRRLPVVRDGQLVGIVTRGDLIKALAGPPARSGQLPR